MYIIWYTYIYIYVLLLSSPLLCALSVFMITAGGLFLASYSSSGDLKEATVLFAAKITEHSLYTVGWQLNLQQKTVRQSLQPNTFHDSQQYYIKGTFVNALLDLQGIVSQGLMEVLPQRFGEGITIITTSHLSSYCWWAKSYTSWHIRYPIHIYIYITSISFHFPSGKPSLKTLRLLGHVFLPSLKASRISVSILEQPVQTWWLDMIRMYKKQQLSISWWSWCETI